MKIANHFNKYTTLLSDPLINFDISLWLPHKESTQTSEGTVWSLPEDFFGQNDPRIQQSPVQYVDPITGMKKVYENLSEKGEPGYRYANRTLGYTNYKMERFIHPYFNFLGSESGSNNYYEIESNEKISSDFYDIEIKIPETNVMNISEEGNWGPARQNFSPSFQNNLLNYMDFYTMTLDRSRYKVNQNHIIGCGDHHSLILTNIGKVWAFGRNNYGQLGNITNSGTDNSNQNPLEIEEANDYNKLNAISVACGGSQSTILLDTGKILSCGRNNYGQLGNPTNSGTDIPNYTLLPVEAVNGYNGENGITVSCGANHTVIIVDEGTLLSCGRNNYGQLGHDTNSGTDTPNEYVNQFTTTEYYNGINATAISCGVDHTIVLLNTGKVLSCGRNNYGQLGTSINSGTDISNSTLLEVEHNADYNGENAIAIGCGDYHTAILLTTGKVLTCGRNNYGQLGNPTNSGTNIENSHLITMEPAANYDLTNAIDVKCGNDTTLILIHTIDSSGTIISCGRNNYGQLANEENAGTDQPNNIFLPAHNMVNVKSFSCGKSHFLALNEIGYFDSFGNNFYGQLGNIINVNQNTSNIQTIGVADYTTISDPKFITGISNYLSNYSMSLTQRNTVNNYFLISGGENHSIILNNEKSFSFGSNYYGQLANIINNGSDKYNLGLNLKNSSQEDYNNILSVSAGENHNGILSYDDSNNNNIKVSMFGRNNYGQLGINTTTNQLYPTDVLVSYGYDQTNAKSVVCGYNHTAVLLNTGKALTCGRNNMGQLGNSTNYNTDSPNSLLNEISDENFNKNLLYKSGHHYFSGYTTTADASRNFVNSINIIHGIEQSIGYITNTGRVYLWGYGGAGNLGVGTTKHYAYPIEPIHMCGYNGKNAKSIGVGQNHILLLLNTGKILVCGNAGAGRLGRGYYNSGDNNGRRYELSEVKHTGGYDGTNVIQIATGEDQNLLILNTGKVLAFGYNNYKQCGQATTQGSGIYEPTEITQAAGYNGTNGKMVACGKEFSLVLLTSGKVIGFGRNYYGTLGNTTNNNTNTGVQGPVAFIENASNSSYTGSNAISIGCGGYFSGIILENGRLETVGWNNGGPLGYGETNMTNPTPREISHTGGYNGSNAVKFTGGFHHSMVLLSNGRVLTAGYNQYGQLGRNTNTIGTTNANTTFLEIEHTTGGYDGTNAIDIAGSEYSSYVVLNNGKVLAFGTDYAYGELARNVTDGWKNANDTPLEIYFPYIAEHDGIILNNEYRYKKDNVSMVSCGNDFTTMILNSGKLVGCGNNEYGQLGSIQYNYSENPFFKAQWGTFQQSRRACVYINGLSAAPHGFFNGSSIGDKGMYVTGYLQDGEKFKYIFAGIDDGDHPLLKMILAVVKLGKIGYVDIWELLETRYIAYSQDISIGSSTSNTKTVTLPFDDMTVSSNPINTQKSTWNDTFEATVEGRQLTVRRTDSSAGWGQSLVLRAYLSTYLNGTIVNQKWNDAANTSNLQSLGNGESSPNDQTGYNLYSINGLSGIILKIFDPSGNTKFSGKNKVQWPGSSSLLESWNVLADEVNDNADYGDVCIIVTHDWVGRVPAGGSMETLLNEIGSKFINYAHSGRFGFTMAFIKGRKGCIEHIGNSNAYADYGYIDFYYSELLEATEGDLSFNSIETKTDTLIEFRKCSGYDGTNAISVKNGENHTAVLLDTGKVLTCGKNDRGQLGFRKTHILVSLKVGSSSGNNTVCSIYIQVSTNNTDWYAPRESCKKTILYPVGTVDESHGVLTSAYMRDTVEASHFFTGFDTGHTYSKTYVLNENVKYIRFINNGGDILNFEWIKINDITLSDGIASTSIGYSGNYDLAQSNYDDYPSRTFEIPSSARIAGSNNGIYSKNHDLMEVGLSTNSGEYDGTNAIAISCGEKHTAVLLSNGKVLTCGDNTYGQLGNSINYGSNNITPYLVAVLESNGYNGSNAIAVECGNNHTIILLNTGKILTFGNNRYAQLGNKINIESLTGSYTPYNVFSQIVENITYLLNYIYVDPITNEYVYENPGSCVFGIYKDGYSEDGCIYIDLSGNRYKSKRKLSNGEHTLRYKVRKNLTGGYNVSIFIDGLHKHDVINGGCNLNEINYIGTNVLSTYEAGRINYNSDTNGVTGKRQCQIKFFDISNNISEFHIKKMIRNEINAYSDIAYVTQNIADHDPSFAPITNVYLEIDPSALGMNSFPESIKYIKNNRKTPYIGKYDYSIVSKNSLLKINSWIDNTINNSNTINREGNWYIFTDSSGNEHFLINSQFPTTNVYRYGYYYLDTYMDMDICGNFYYPTQLNVEYKNDSNKLVLMIDKQNIFNLMYGFIYYWLSDVFITNITYKIYAWVPNSSRLPTTYHSTKNLVDLSNVELFLPNAADIIYELEPNGLAEKYNPNIPNKYNPINNLVELTDNLIAGEWLFTWTYEIKNDLYITGKGPIVSEYDVSINRVMINTSNFLYEPRQPNITTVVQSNKRNIQIDITNGDKNQLVNLINSINTTYSGLTVASVKLNYYLWPPNKEKTYKNDGWELNTNFLGKEDNRFTTHPVKYYDLSSTTFLDYDIDNSGNISKKHYGFDISNAIIKTQIINVFPTGQSIITPQVYDLSEITTTDNLPDDTTHKINNNPIPYVARWSYELVLSNNQKYYSDISANINSYGSEYQNLGNEFYRSMKIIKIDLSGNKTHMINSNNKYYYGVTYVSPITQDEIIEENNVEEVTEVCDTCAIKRGTTKTEEVLTSRQRLSNAANNFNFAGRLSGSFSNVPCTSQNPSLNKKSNCSEAWIKSHGSHVPKSGKINQLKKTNY